LGGQNVGQLLIVLQSVNTPQNKYYLHTRNVPLVVNAFF
jgi:hypothetical protein